MITYKLNNEMFVCILFVPKKQAIKINAPKKKQINYVKMHGM